MPTNEHPLQARTSVQSSQSRQVSSATGKTLQGDPQGQKEVVLEIHNRFHAMKTYGKAPESLDSIIAVMLRDLEGYPRDKVMAAFKLHAQRSAEFPTTADLIGIIKRNGKPPLRESDVIAIRRKDGELRTPEEWAMLREWDAQAAEGWGSEYRNEQKERATLEENIRLRQRVAELEAEVRRAWDAARSQAVQVPRHLDQRPAPARARSVDEIMQGLKCQLEAVKTTMAGAPEARDV